MSIKHVPVMYQEILDNLPKNMSSFMDGTVGHGGHSKLIKQQNKELNLIAVDRDPNIIKVAKKNLSEFENIQFVLSSYSNLDYILKDRKVDTMLLDLGVNMEHFKDASRGFSIKRNGPLDMRFSPETKKTALYILKNYNQTQLEDMFQKWGDFKGKILQDIVRVIIKSKHRLKTTFDLKEVLKTIKLSEKKIAVVFQCLRIEVNDELLELESFLDRFGSYLNTGGRCMIITYHSIEDRLVKNKFKELDKNGFKNITKKVIFPTLQEIEKNKASSSAKLRIIEKI